MLQIHRTIEGSTFQDLRAHAELDFDIRYARADNFLGRAVYSEAGAYLQKEPTEALLRASQILAQEGAGILVFDAYRPWEVTRVFWEESSLEGRKFLANPELGSVHNRGCAIDCGLFDLRTRKPLDMPSDFDEFSPRAYSDFAGGTPEQTRNRELLFHAMKEAGFRGISHEWWHFNHPAAAHYPVYDLSFEVIREAVKRR